MKYAQYTDYFFKSVVRDRLNGVLSFLKIPHKIDEVIMNEFSQLPPKINRLDFAGISVKNGEEICVIIEYQSTVPTEEDIERFFQYVSSLRQFKRKKIELGTNNYEVKVCFAGQCIYLSDEFMILTADNIMELSKLTLAYISSISDISKLEERELIFISDMGRDIRFCENAIFCKF